MIRRTSASAFRTAATLDRLPGTKVTAALLAVGAFMVVSVAAGPAKAGSIDCTPTIVWFDGYTGGRLAIFCNGDNNINHAIIANQDSGLMSYRKLAELHVQVGSGLEVKDSVAVGDFAAGIRKAAGT